MSDDFTGKGDGKVLNGKVGLGLLRMEYQVAGFEEKRLDLYQDCVAHLLYVRMDDDGH